MRDAENIEAVICIGFLEVCWHCGGHRLKLFGIWCWEERRLLGNCKSALELVSRWKKRQSGTETGSYGRLQELKQGETGDVFSEYQNRKGLKQKDGTWNLQSDT